MSATIYDVAQRAGVGIGTVSRVLNNNPKVSETTREKVLAAVKELGFEPNLAARQLSGGKTHAIGILTPYLTYPSFVEWVASIQKVLDPSFYDLVLYGVRSPTRLKQQLHTIINQNRVDGLIVLALAIDETEIQALKPDFPIVSVVDDGDLTYYPYAKIDNFKGGVLATSYLIARGHRAIGFVGDPINNLFGFKSTIRRYEGFQHALNQAGLQCHADWCRFGEHAEDSAREIVREILQMKDRPSALFMAADTLALGALPACADLGFHIPQDIAIIGFDDIQAARYTQLTTVRQHLDKSGEWLAQRMLTWLQNGHPGDQPLKHEFELEIVARATV